MKTFVTISDVFWNLPGWCLTYKLTTFGKPCWLVMSYSDYESVTIMYSGTSLLQTSEM